jgi:uncharacterized protein
VAGFISEWRPGSNRNGGRHQIGIPGRIASEFASLGTAIAAYLARHRPVRGLILVTPFDSLEALARELYWWAPVGLLLRHRMPTLEFVRGALTPTAVIVADRDKVVPARRSTPLRRAVSNLVFARTIDAGHNDLYDHPDFAEAMREGLAAIEAVQSSLLDGQIRSESSTPRLGVSSRDDEGSALTP